MAPQMINKEWDDEVCEKMADAIERARSLTIGHKSGTVRRKTTTSSYNVPKDSHSDKVQIHHVHQETTNIQSVKQSLKDDFDN